MVNIVKTMEALAKAGKIKTAYNIDLSVSDKYSSSKKIIEYFGLAQKKKEDPDNIFVDVPRRMHDNESRSQPQMMKDPYDTTYSDLPDNPLYSIPPMYFITFDGQLVANPFAGFMEKSERNRFMGTYVMDFFNEYPPDLSLTYQILSSKSMWLSRGSEFQRYKYPVSPWELMTNTLLYSYLYSLDKADERILDMGIASFPELVNEFCKNSEMTKIEVLYLEKILLKAIARYLTGDMDKSMVLLGQQKEVIKSNFVRFAYLLYLHFEDLDIKPFIIDCLKGEEFNPKNSSSWPGLTTALKIFNLSNQIYRNIEAGFQLDSFTWILDSNRKRNAHCPLFTVNSFNNIENVEEEGFIRAWIGE